MQEASGRAAPTSEYKRRRYVVARAITKRAVTKTKAPARVIDVGEARAFLVSHLGLARFRPEKGAVGVRAMLSALRCVQLDPLDPIGTNADLVTLARVKGTKRGDVYASLLPGHAFEHFAKERCLLPPDAFPYYRSRMVETPWWRSSERGKRVDAALLATVLDEVRARGPISAKDLEDRGSVVPLDWSGWKGTSSAAKMALEILWTRCEVVVTARRGKEKLYDVPARALPSHHDAELTLPFEEWAIEERVVAAGLLGESVGPSWSMLRDAKKSGAVERLIELGRIERVRVGDRSSTYLAPAGFLDRPIAKPDSVMRVLGPLDPMLWDRALVKQAFEFEYVWEVYKPASQRRWGWYVCPLLHRGRLVGRIDARIDGDALVVDRVFREKGVPLDDDALDVCLARHAEACGVSRVRRRRR
jgi:uncharacterized protein YcaQ